MKIPVNMPVPTSHLVWLAVIVALFAIGGALSLVWHEETKELFFMFADNPVATSVIYVSAFVIATVVAPITATPLIPLAAGLLPPLAVALLSIVGWTIGAVIAFLIGRRLGRPFALKVVGEKAIAMYEREVPENMELFMFILLRMIIPVDVLSYVAGVVSRRLSLFTYIWATVVGIAPFSFIFAYSGAALWEGQFGLFAVIGVAGVLIYIILRYAYAYIRNNNAHAKEKEGKENRL